MELGPNSIDDMNSLTMQSCVGIIGPATSPHILWVQARFYVALHWWCGRSMHLYCFHMASQRWDFT